MIHETCFSFCSWITKRLQHTPQTTLLWIRWSRWTNKGIMKRKAKQTVSDTFSHVFYSNTFVTDTAFFAPTEWYIILHIRRIFSADIFMLWIFTGYIERRHKNLYVFNDAQRLNWTKMVLKTKHPCINNEVTISSFLCWTLF